MLALYIRNGYIRKWNILGCPWQTEHQRQQNSPLIAGRLRSKRGNLPLQRFQPGH